MAIYVTSDLHFNHTNICNLERYMLDRNSMQNITTVEEYNNMVVRRINEVVDEKDTLYILGDFAFGNFQAMKHWLSKLNGYKILILGNHDKIPDHLKCYFNHITQIKNITFKKSVYPFLYRDLEVIMCHFPMLSWEHKDKKSIMLHGHCHGKVDDINTMSKDLRVDVGLDAKLANYNLISLEKISNYFEKIEKENE